MMHFILQNDGCGYWNGWTWTVDIECARVFTGDTSSVKLPPEPCKIVGLIMGEQYPPNGKIFNRVQQLMTEVFGDLSPLVELNASAYCDPCIEFDGVLAIYWSDDTRIVTGLTPTLQPGYQICVITHDPGVMYHRDGSGTPPSSDTEDVGKPHRTLELAMAEVVKLVAEVALNDFLDYENDMQEAERVATN